MTTDTKINGRINGRVKFYNQLNGFGFITTEDKKEFYFNSSDLSEHYIPRMGDLISFAPNEENLKKSQKPRATYVCPKALNTNSNTFLKRKIECYNCGKLIVPKWTNDKLKFSSYFDLEYSYNQKISSCLFCGKIFSTEEEHHPFTNFLINFFGILIGIIGSIFYILLLLGLLNRLFICFGLL